LSTERTGVEVAHPLHTLCPSRCRSGSGAPPESGYIRIITPDGQLRQVADDIQFPNICTAKRRLADGHVANLERLATGPRTGEILALPVEVPGTGRP
jgi:hypothetical protein